MRKSVHLNSWPVDARTRLVGILGHPVSHSFSPLLHNAAFFAQGLNLRYVALDVPPTLLPAAVKGLGALGFAGANVTIPHKRAVITLLTHVSPQARAIGAVNTIVCRRAGTEVIMTGENTDVEGFVAPLMEYAAFLRGQSALIFGAGGAARAAAYALMDRFSLSRVVVAARNPDRARQLCMGLAPCDPGSVLLPVALSDAGPHVKAAGVVVNATPVGMHPHVTKTPWPDTESFREGQVVYDLIYRPLKTRLMADAAIRGAIPIGGLPMLLRQAAVAYRHWTGRSMPLSEARSALPAV